MSKLIVGIMGPGDNATGADLKNAYDVGKLCAIAGYVVMTGGRACGVMEAGLKGAKDGGGQTLGVLPYKSKDDASNYADIAVVTGLNSARNYINALTSDVLVACGVCGGTLSEIALALKEGKKVILFTENQKAKDFLIDLYPSQVVLPQNPQEALKIIVDILPVHKN